jgi:hypothetical protein
MSKVSLSVSVSEKVREKLDTLAEEEGVSRSQATERVLRDSEKLTQEPLIRRLLDNAELTGIIWLGMVLGVGFEYLVVVSTGLVMATLLIYKIYAGL